MDCSHKEGRWRVRRLWIGQEDNQKDEDFVAEIPADDGGDKWKPFAVSEGFCFFRRFEGCSSCRHAKKVMKTFYERMN